MREPYGSENRSGQRAVAKRKQEELEMLKKSISIMMAILMIAAVTTVSAFAAVPIGGNDADGEIFFDPDTYEYAGDQAQHSVVSADYDDGTVTIVFSKGPEQGPGGVYYWGTVAVLSAGVAYTLTDTANDTQTLVYEQGDETDYVDFEFQITVTPVEGGSGYTHRPHTYAVNVDPA
jgi:hypothetical protein